MNGDQMMLPLGDIAKSVGQQEALARVDDWTGEAWRCLVLLVGEGRPFTSEDLIERIGLPSGEVGTNRNNAVGAIMTSAAKQRLIRKTGQRVKARRAVSHAAELTEWIAG